MIWLRTLLFALTFVAIMLVLVPRWILGAEGRAHMAAGSARRLRPYEQASSA